MRIYTASLLISALAAARTLLYITVPTNRLVTLINSSVTNATNETNEQIRCTWQNISTLGTPTGTTLTPARHDLGDPVAGSTVVGNVTAGEPTYAANTEIGHEGAPSLSGWVFPSVPLPRDALPRFAGASNWGLRILAAPTAFDAVVRVTFGEEG